MLAPDRLAYSPDEVAEGLGVSRAHVYTLIERGLLHRYKLGKSCRIRADEVWALIGGPPADGPGAA